MKNQILTRRDFLRTTAVAAGAAALGVTTSAFAAKKRKPNMIFIMADDLGYGDLGCYGGKDLLTPCVDRMAAEGIRFTQVYAGHCVCAPSRSVLMTGQHGGHTRVRENKAKKGGWADEVTGGRHRLPLFPEDVTIAEVLKKADYATGITGKWGLGEVGSPGEPNKQGFDEWLGYLNQNHAVYYYTDYLWKDGKKITLEGNKNGKKQQYTHDVFTDFAMDFIRRHKDKPFFLYIPYTIPHFNIEAPCIEPYADKPWKEGRKIWAAMITRMDKDVGRILKLLKTLGIDDNTIVFFCSDNGAAGGSSGPLRGGKGKIQYEGGVRTPMVVRWPGTIPTGKVSDNQWYFPDVMATLAELAGVEPPKNIDGVSVLPSLMGKKQNELYDRFMYWEDPPRPRMIQAARWRDWKISRRVISGKADPIKLYNLKDDIGERHDVADKHPDIVAVFEKYLKTARTPSPYWPDNQTEK